MQENGAAAKSVSQSMARLLSFVAISQLSRGDEVLRQLIFQCLVFFPSETFRQAEDFAKTLMAIFGLEIATARIELALQQEIRAGSIERNSVHSLTINSAMSTHVEASVTKANHLQSRVRSAWAEVLRHKYPELELNLAWACLQDYLFKLFRRHGLQTVALLDNNMATSGEHAGILKANLREVVLDNCNGVNNPKLETAINEFLATVGADPDRTSFIVQLADGAFNYFSLNAPPEVASQLQSKLHELTLFLDTNFLFGVFGLDTTPLVAVSHELLKVVTEQKLPFRLRYHEATYMEMRRTINAISSSIKSHHWSSELSRAAANAPYVSGIERHFHEENARNSVDADIFFKPYEHLDVLLKERGIEIFRAAAQRLTERADLITRYKDFLATKNRSKPYEVVDHDMTVLDTVRTLRSKSTSSLEAKALLITCDTVLNRFDWQELEAKKGYACTVLPNQFLQLLRPYVPSTPNFDQSFAAAFAIPEFRAISGGYHLASARLLTLLATYKDIKEETASALLANTLLLDELQKAPSANRMRELVESAIVASNATLLEERIALRNQLQAKEARITQIDAVAQQLTDASKERDAFVDRVAELDNRAGAAERARDESQASAARETAQLQGRLAGLERRAAESQTTLERFKASVSVLVTIVISGSFELALHHWNWTWLLNHPNSYALRAVTYVGVLLLLLGIAIPKRRSTVWGAAGIVAVGWILLSLLGGPHG